MTIKHNAPPSSAPVEQFPERPPRHDMQNSLYLDRPGHQTALIRHFGATGTTLVIGEMPVGRNVRQREGLLYPDLLVAFNVDPAAAIGRRGFAIEEQGKPPDFVLEVASLNTALNDYTSKRAGYAAYGIPEYWRFDPTGGDYYPVPLAGDRLVNGEYQPVTVARLDHDRYWGHSEALNLDLCWEHGQLRWYDPASRSYLRTHDDALDAIITAEDRIRQLEQELRCRSQ